MSGRGEPAKVRRDAGEGKLDVLFSNEVRLQYKENPGFEKEWREDQIYISSEPGSGTTKRILAQGLKRTVELLSQHLKKETVPQLLRNQRKHPYCLILARTNYAYGIRLHEFQARLIDIFCHKQGINRQAMEQLLEVTTAHKSKGQEAELVIVLEATERRFPLIHPDNLLFQIFGVTPKDVLDEERRLFYVAVTRAKHRLCVLTDEDVRSPFIDTLVTTSLTHSRPVADKRADSVPFSGLAARIQSRLSP